jgi:hypothetical protein
MVGTISLGLRSLACAALPLFAVAAAAEPAPVAPDIAAEPPSAMTNEAIAQHNAALEPRDPAFIRCRRIAIAGSLVKKARVCKTNADWAKSWQDGNQNARDTYDAMNRGSSNSVEPVDEFTPRGAQNRPE